MMKFQLTGAKEIVSAAKELRDFGIEICEGGRPVAVKEGKTFKITCGARILIEYTHRVQIFRALKHLADGGTDATFAPHFEDLTYMMDCSRNAVAKPETVEALVRYLAVMGYTSLGLYMEDTFELEGYPYFGYLRTPYSVQDLKRLDAYCARFGIALVPYIQTLAHFNTLTRHYAMESLFDTGDILFTGEEETYRFIEAIIATCAKTFSSRDINIGMDEAYMLGRGRYLDKHGLRPRFDIMTEHLVRVLEICKKYGYSTPMMWSDMFFTQTFATQQYKNELPAEIAARIPKDVELIYWDYGETNKAHYAENLRRHASIGNRIGFAGGACKWHGYTPDNRNSFRACRAAAEACIDAGIPRFIVTGWGDNGGESSQFSILPTLFECASITYGLPEGTEDGFETLTGLSLDDFMSVDLCNRLTPNDGIEGRNTANKYLLFNDILLGTLDTTIPEGVGALYVKHARKLASVRDRAQAFSYLFETQFRLARVLSVKAELGIKLRKAYQAGDRKRLGELLGDLKELPRLVECFYRALSAQWHLENRSNGFDVQDIRVGALKQRIYVAIEKVTAYLDGTADSIPELEEHLLDHMAGGETYQVDLDQCEWRWRRMTSVNVNE